MKVRVKLFGTLPQRYPEYDLEDGLEVEIPDGARVKDLMAYLELSSSDGGVAAIDNVVVNVEEKLKEGVCVRIFQGAFGG
jgi:sulfur carrier protein ThiS